MVSGTMTSCMMMYGQDDDILAAHTLYNDIWQHNFWRHDILQNDIWAADILYNDILQHGFWHNDILHDNVWATYDILQHNFWLNDILAADFLYLHWHLATQFMA